MEPRPFCAVAFHGFVWLSVGKTLLGAEFIVPLENRYDQVPDSFCNFKLETYDPIGAGIKHQAGCPCQCWKEGVDTKHFCTIQIFHRMTGSGKPDTTHSDVMGV